MTENTSVYFLDITKIGKDLTGKRDISLIFNEQALLESIMNILQTEPGDRVMHPTFGCSLEQYLFDPIDQITALYIQKQIETSILTFEPRAENLQVIVEPDEENNTFNISVIFTMLIVNTQKQLNFQLNKIR